MDIDKEGECEIWGLSDPDEAREWFSKNKTLEMIDKRMPIKKAVEKFVKDGDYLGLGCFGHVRVSMIALYEIIRQKKRNLTVAGHTAVHDLDILLAGGCVSRVEVAYSFGHEFRPMRSPLGQKLIREGKLKTNEWSNAAFTWRYRAAAMGVSFLPVRVMLGTDTMKYSSAKIINCPFTGKKYCAVPALYPDVALIHVHRCDIYGNCQIDGAAVADIDLARAAKRLIITTEKIIDHEEIRREPYKTMIPYYHVDAVVHARYGAHPCEMPYMYWFDEEHIAEYLKATKTEEDLKEYMNKYVYNVRDFNEYLELIGGEDKMKKLERIEKLEEKPPFPW